MPAGSSGRRSHSSHWGAFSASVDSGRIEVVPHPEDQDPSPLLGNVPGAVDRAVRVDRPYARRGWLERGPGPDLERGTDTYVPVSWERAVELTAGELRRVIAAHGNRAVYGGSYGWSSAGRFHHAQGQLHRFMNCIGGCTRSWHSYSTGTSEVLLPHVLGSDEPLRRPTTWPVIAASTELFVCFGGLPAKNTFVNPGGASRHRTAEHLRAARRRGAEFWLLSPLGDDLAQELGACWQPVRPGTDVAVMLALGLVLLEEGLCDGAFLDRCCTGFRAFAAYLRGEEDGVAKTPEWAERLSGVPASLVRDLARRMAARRTMVTVSWSLQRCRHGEQPVWAGIALAAMLGQIGLPGGGFGHGYGSMGNAGAGRLPMPLPTLPQGANPVREAIPVARVADMLLGPGTPYDFNGSRRRYPDIRLVYWTGGNPFHHHQDLTRLRQAFCRPDTVVVHDPFWTSTARHADLVLPATVTLEREDIGAGRDDDLLIAMQRVAPPLAEARDDHAIFADLARELGVEDAFTGGRDTRGWLRHLYERWRRMAGSDQPDFDEFWRRGELRLRESEPWHVSMADFRDDPEAHPLRTPSGRIEIFSERIAGFHYADCPPHPSWLEPDEWLGAPSTARHPLHLIANNPASRLHSQLDHGAGSRATKVRGREPVRMNPADALARGIADGDVVRVFNDRGACLAGAVLSGQVMPSVVQLSTGAWFDPVVEEDGSLLCVHGNPNVLTADVGSSRLAQGCSGQHALVQVERFDRPLPPIRAYTPPIETQGS